MEKVLIVENHELVSLALQAVVEEYGFAVDTAASADKAISLINENDYRIITLDGTLNNSSGQDVLNEVGEENKEKIMIFSGNMKFLMEAGKAGYEVHMKSEDFIEIFERKVQNLKN